MLLIVAPAAQASFGLHEFDLAFTGPPPPGTEFTQADERGEVQTQAGLHPFAMTTTLALNTETTPGGAFPAGGEVKDAEVTQIPGFIGDQAAMAQCPTVDFLIKANGINDATECPESTVVGLVRVRVAEGAGPITIIAYAPVYNLTAPPGSAARLGFIVESTPVTISIGVSEAPPYELIAHTRNISQILEFFSAELTLWGIPGDPRHDPLRGECLASFSGGSEAATKGDCSAAGPIPFLTLPRACQGPLTTSYALDSWEAPGSYLPDGEPNLADPRWASGSLLTHDEAGPQGMTGCGVLGFAPGITAQPTTRAATSPSGLDFSLDVNDEGLTSASDGVTAASDIRKAVVTLPEGFSTNPSLAEGLVTCSEADLARESSQSEPGAACPNAAKIGTVEVETPLLDESVKGSLYIATPYENPFHSLLALYIVLKNPTLGISIVQPLKVENDPVTGQITTVAEELPQLPFSHFRLHFREGTRSPLATPPACGTYDVRAELTPWSGGSPVTSTSAFQIISGPDAGPCPSGGTPPFHPGLIAGSINNAAGRFSPFDVRLSRTDSEQEITHFSIKLPPGLLGKLAGIPFCSEAAIAQATARTGPHGGQEELDSPSCPAASQVGRTLAGSGVGPALAYAPGKIYLAGPYHGHPVSLVAITAGVVGPFDIGTVVVRLALDVNPETGEVFLDSTGSDPIPHIIKGIPIHLRDIRAYTDRPEFTFNPTSCEPTSTSSTVLGAGLDFASPLDDNPLVVSTRFQAADCAALPFKPKLTLSLKGSTKRGGNPALHAHLEMKGIGATGANEAGVAYTQVALPPTEFLDNAHVNGPCTRVQFKEGALEGEKCPPTSIIGHAKAVTPILSEPLEGPVYLKSNPERSLPDIAAALHGQEINVVLVGHTDSAPGGGLRNTFEVVPDAPVTSFDLDLLGGKKGLLENAPKGTATSICGTGLKAAVKFKGHNGKVSNFSDPIHAAGCKHKKSHKRGHALHRGGSSR